MKELKKLNKIIFVFIAVLLFMPVVGYTANYNKVKVSRFSPDKLKNILNNTNKKIKKNVNSAFKKFNSRYYNKWKVKYNKISRKVERLYGFHTKAFRGNLQKEGKAFLKENYDLFQIDTDTLLFVKQDKVSKFIHTGYQQYYKNIPVENGIIKMSYLNDGRLIYIYSRYVYDIDLPTVPVITQQDAVNKALQDLNPVKYKQESIKTGLVIYLNETNGEKYLCYKVSLFSHSPLGAFIYFIDALNGNVIGKFNILKNASGTVEGEILPKYHDDDLVSMPIKNAYVKVNNIRVKTDTSGNFTSSENTGFVYTSFEGPNFKVINADENEAFTNFGPSNYNAINIKWIFSKTDTYMDELNIFYHLERMRSYFSNTSGENKIDYQMRVYVHNGEDDDIEDLNAYFQPLDGGLYFGDGNLSKGLGNFSHFADIIYHEYTHAVVENIYYRKIINLGEHGAINEAFADYFSCSFLDDSIIGENCLPASYTRDLSGFSYKNRFPDDWVGEEHDDSLIFSQALWEIRTSLSNTLADADELIYNSLYFGPVSFNSGMEAILISDDNDGDLSNGTPNESEITDAFKNHGIPTTKILLPNDTFELNNSFEEAYTVNLDQDYESYISIKGDFDYYKFSLKPRDKSDYLTIKLKLPYYSGDLYYAYNLYIYNKDKKNVDKKEIENLYTVENDTENLFAREDTVSITMKPEEDIYYVLITGTSGCNRDTGKCYNTSSAIESYILTCNTIKEKLNNVKVYPNPYKPNDNKVSSGDDDSGIIFQGLVKNTKLKIYDLKGRLIFQKALPISGWWQWDVKNNNGEDVSSGIYFYVLTSGSGKPTKGKFAIIR